MSPKGRWRALLFRSFSVAEGDVCAPEPMQMSATCLFHDSAERRNTVCSPFGRYSRAQPSPLLEGRRGAKIVRFFLNFTAFFPFLSVCDICWRWASGQAGPKEQREPRV